MDAVKEFIASVNEQVLELSDKQTDNAISENRLPLILALMYDSVMLYTSALDAMGLTEGGNITCDDQDSWEFGSSIINYVRTVSSNQSLR